MAMQAIDTTHAIDPAELHRVAVVAEGGYSQTGPRPSWKSVLPAVSAGLFAAALGQFLAWETIADAISGGDAAGHQHGRLHCQFMKALGYPLSVLAIFTVDEQVDPARVDAYADGWHRACLEAGRDAGLYGSQPVIDRQVQRGRIVAGWQTASTSWGHGVSAHADLLQTVSSPIPGTDGDRIRNPETRMIWWPNTAPATSPPPFKLPPFPGNFGADIANPEATEQWKFMLIVLGYGGWFKHQTVADFQTYGPGTVAATKDLQVRHDPFLGSHGDHNPDDLFGPDVDGRTVGRKTWNYGEWLVQNTRPGAN